MSFRYDINGLRAIAVIAVVLFHFNPAWAPGGFAGVDVFFVISGFLMTGIIFRGLERDSFNIFKFYMARANRIIPAMTILCLVILVFGWFYLSPFGYRELGKHVSSSLGFVSNVVYWRESGYFDAASHEKWLLHTWSLSVEWQFYILYPIVLVALKKFLSLENLKRLIVVGTILGFSFSVIATMKWPNPAYYLLPTRAWEMMMGGVAFLYPWSFSESRKKAVELIGLALILGSYVFVSSDVPWPGHFALLPVLGAYLIIVSNRQSSFITNNALFQYLGKWSYSIYLWHWPVVVFLYFYELHSYELFGIFASIVLGFSSYYFVESKKAPFKVIIALWLLVVSVSTLILFNSNFIDYPESILGHNINDNGKAKYIGLSQDHFINTNKVEDVDFIGIGDSNLVHLSFGIKNSASVKVLLSGAGSCLTFPDYTRKPYASFMDEKWLQRCSSIYKRVLNSSKDVIWSQSWKPTEVICTSDNCKTGRPEEDYYSVLEEQITKMSRLVGEGRAINIIGWSPAPKESLVTCTKARLKRCSGDVFTESSDVRLEVNNHLYEISSKLENVHFINPFHAICNEKNECKTVESGKNLFFDAGHLSGFGALKVWPYIEQRLKKGSSTDLP